MKKFIKNFKVSEAILSLGFVVATISANTICFYMIHQPEEPEAVRNLNKLIK